MNHRFALAAAAAAAALATTAAPARAQSLRPNVMFLFDTSLSMRETSAAGNTYQADGTTVCPTPNGTTNATRIFNLKSGLRAALQQVGTDEANFGLMSFPEQSKTAYTAVSSGNCSNIGTTVFGHYQPSPDKNSYTVANRTTSTWHPTANDYPAGCVMSTEPTSTAQSTVYGSWFQTGASEVFHVGVTAAAPGTAPTTTQFDPPGGNVAAVYKWIDNTEAPTSNGAVTDPELHANDLTPLGHSLFYANLYFQNEIIKNDPKGSCRHNVVVIATDGDETCDEVTAPNSSFSNTDCSGGGSFDQFHPINQACLLAKMGVKVYVITDISADNANDAIAAAGGTVKSIRVSLNDPNAAKSAIVGIIAQNVPPAEICNGLDDNCNGQIDEGVKNQCPLDTDPSHVGHPELLTQCQTEQCNCKDDNCNGQVDEGWPPNKCGGPCGCAVPTEICNGIDDNCDGIIDNGNWPTGPVGTKCNNGLMGACNRDGYLVCNAAGSDTICNAPVVTPQPEVCNGIDDNCDGAVDEGTLPGVGEKCGNGLGACQAGTIICKNGQLVCNVTSTPQTEVCDGIDNDCDGIVDDGNFSQTDQPCLCPGLDESQVGVGICKAGKLKCMGALGFVCVGCVLPTSGEVCNGKDNDCNGVVDTTGNCPNGYACKDGACTLQCSGGEFPCPLGYKCVNAYCVPQRCASVMCPAGQNCDENTGLCVSNCANVKCSGAATCVNGACVDCNQLGCDPGKICVAGMCIADLCNGVTCGNNQYCKDGTCQDLCLPGKCGASQSCVAGQCTDDPCAQKFCPNGSYCDSSSGKCEENKCLAIQCQAGQQCVPAKATQDPSTACETDPCATISCPSQCWTCGITNDGAGTCLLNSNCQPVSSKVGQHGGGESGCSCEVGGGAGQSGWLALAVGLMVVATRRRRRG